MSSWSHHCVHACMFCDVTSLGNADMAMLNPLMWNMVLACYKTTDFYLPVGHRTDMNIGCHHNGRGTDPPHNRSKISTTFHFLTSWQRSRAQRGYDLAIYKWPYMKTIKIKNHASSTFRHTIRFSSCTNSWILSKYNESSSISGNCKLPVLEIE